VEPFIPLPLDCGLQANASTQITLPVSTYLVFATCHLGNAGSNGGTSIKILNSTDGDVLAQNTTVLGNPSFLNSYFYAQGGGTACTNTSG
jgi:hypothetical protein